MCGPWARVVEVLEAPDRPWFPPSGRGGGISLPVRSQGGPRQIARSMADPRLAFWLASIAAWPCARFVAGRGHSNRILESTFGVVTVSDACTALQPLGSRGPCSSPRPDQVVLLAIAVRVSPACVACARPLALSLGRAWLWIPSRRARCDDLGNARLRPPPRTRCAHQSTLHSPATTRARIARSAGGCEGGLPRATAITKKGR